jgi:hypothetical protein
MLMKRNVDQKYPILSIILLHFCLAFLLSSCDVTASCNLQAVAGGAQYCHQVNDGK